MDISELHVLVAEDDDFQRFMMVKMLGDLGITRIIEAADGRAALDVFQDLGQPVDIIISDLHMPEMDGMEFIRHVGESGAPASIILTSSLEPALIASVENMTKAYGINLLGAIEKPATAAKLAHLIKQHRPPGSQPAAPAHSVEDLTRGLRAGEFGPYYQPKVEIATGRIVGAEALARWHHPQHGVLTPRAFLSLIEENALMDELTWTMLARAGVDCKRWRAGGLDATVSVNLSRHSLTDTTIADRVTEVVRSTGLDPRHVVLEATERVAVTDVATVLENLARLRMNGFGLAIDDYGTGNSSMQQLSRIPFAELKIDRTFVSNASRHERQRPMLEASLDLAKKLRLKSTAEGVESRQAWDLLAGLGCDMAQGYFIAKAMDIAAFSDWALEGWIPPDQR